jgi:spermidine/putrescine transport system ATP-binding protein
MTYAIEVQGIRKEFQDVVALHDIALGVHEGEFISLLGPSGCGKTTLLRIISGFEMPTRGRVLIRDADVTTMPPHRRPTNIVFQRGALFPHMNVGQNVGYSLRLRGWDRSRIDARVNEMLALVRLEGLASRGPTELSGGQIQRAALARALAAEPSVLLLDEPLSALDLKLRQHMQLELRAIQRKLGATFIYVTHDQTEALVMSDRIAVMNHGWIEQIGAPREIYTRPTSVFASDFIGETNLLRGTILTSDGTVHTVVLDDGGPAVAATSESSLPAGAKATMSVRPESVAVTTDTTSLGAPGWLAGRVTMAVYLGNRVRVELSLDGGSAITADVRDEDAGGLEAGTDVAVRWIPTSARVWADQS